VNFSDRAFIDQGFTSDIAALNQGLSHFDSKGTTAIYDAVAASADELASHGKLPKQVLLVITDGADNASRLDLEQAIRRVQNLAGQSFIPSDCFSEPTRRKRSVREWLWTGCRRRQEASLTSPIPCRMSIASHRRSQEIFATSTPSAITLPERPARGLSGCARRSKCTEARQVGCEDPQGLLCQEAGTAAHASRARSKAVMIADNPTIFNRLRFYLQAYTVGGLQ